MLSSEYGFGLVLGAIHWCPLILAAAFWPFRDLSLSFGSAITLLFSVASLAIVLFFLLIFLLPGDGNSAHGTPAAWYMIFSVVTLGVIPAIALATHVIAGRFVGFLLRKHFAT